MDSPYKFCLPFLCSYSGMTNYVADKVKEHITGNILVRTMTLLYKGEERHTTTSCAFFGSKVTDGSIFRKISVLKNFGVSNILFFSSDAVI